MPRILASDPDPEKRLEDLLAERRQEFEEQAARLDEAVQDLERREQLLRDSRTSLERLLRLGTSDLESRETELVRLMTDVGEREERVQEQEAELARRREELGAVELKRAALERRERALEEREEALASTAATEAQPDESSPTPLLAFVPGHAYRLVDVQLDGALSGATVLVEGEPYVVSRIGPSPLPGDARRCAYLARAARIA